MNIKKSAQDNIDVSLQEIMGVIVEGINNKLESILTEGLRLKGYNFKSRPELENFLRERCRREQNVHLKNNIYFVDDIPFFFHSYSEEIMIDREENSSKFIANYGSFKYL